jgi:small conductance mechanosensitive channel
MALFRRLTSAVTRRSLTSVGVWLVASTARAAAAVQDTDSPLSDQAWVVVRRSLDRLTAAVIRVLPAVVAAAILLILCWGLATGARRIAGLVAKRLRDRTMQILVTQFTYYAVWALGFIVALDAIGLNLEAVVTGLGLGSVAIGFALKDILSNLVSGMLILLMRPFEMGDQIVIEQTEGTVERIELRATHIRTYDGRLVLVPNGEVFTSRITNNTESPLRRASVGVYLGYQQDLARALSIILDAVKAVPGVAQTPAPSMRVQDLSRECLHLEARFWGESRRADLMNTASAARVAIFDALTAAGFQLPNPDQRFVTIAPADPDAMLRATSPLRSQAPGETAAQAR